MANPSQPGIALGGFMAVGKTTVGRRLAHRLGLPFVDMDEVLEQRHGPIARQFERDGEERFRERERALVAELCDGQPRVVATGGGAWVDPDNRRLLRGTYRTVVLRAPLDELRRRAGAGADRPLWRDADQLLAHREAAYADAELTIDATGDPDVVVDAILSRMQRRIVDVSLGDRSYRVILDPGGPEPLGAELVGAIPSNRCVVVTDSNVAPLWAGAVEASLGARGIRFDRVVVPAGEASKTVETWSEILDRMFELGVDRKTTIVAVGGGVIGDLAGFAAASVLRGVPFVQVPTTLLAMVDSSVGGKTGVNHRRGKNLIGAFYQPGLVYAALGTLATLPERERAAGLGEVVKTALLDARLFEQLERDAFELRTGSPRALVPAIARCVEIKAGIVAKDERETGLRAVLNLGHTVGHGLEAAVGYGGLLHGEAVALGLVAESRFAVRLGVCREPGLPERLRRLLVELGLPSRTPHVEHEAVIAAMQLDKKTGASKLRLPVPVILGESTFVDLPIADLATLLEDLP